MKSGGALATTFWMAGSSHGVFHSRGTGWELVAFLEPAPEDQRQHGVTALAGTSARDVWAAGFWGELHHFDGNAWHRVDSPTKEHLFALWAFAENDVWAAGDFGIVVHYDGARWSTVPFPPAFRVQRFWGPSPQALWALTFGELFVWDGRGWSMVDGVRAGAVWGSGERDVWVSQKHGFLHLGPDCTALGNTPSLPFSMTPAAPEHRFPDTSVESPPTEAEARAFVRELTEIARAGDLERYKAVLSWKQRVRNPPELVRLSLGFARQAPKAEIDHATFSTGRLGESATIRFSVGGEIVLMMLVKREDGVLRLDEN